MRNKFENIRKKTIMDPRNLLKHSTYKNIYTCFNIAHSRYLLVWVPCHYQNNIHQLVFVVGLHVYSIVATKFLNFWRLKPEFYLHIQFVPRSKHVRSRLHKSATSCRIQKYSLFVLTAKQNTLFRHTVWTKVEDLDLERRCIYIYIYITTTTLQRVKYLLHVIHASKGHGSTPELG